MSNKRWLDLGYQKGGSEEPEEDHQEEEKEIAPMQKKKRAKKQADQGQPQEQDTLIRLTGLWTSKSGNALIGNISPSAKLLIFENKNKESDSQPDYIAYIAANSFQQGSEPF